MALDKTHVLVLNNGTVSANSVGTPSSGIDLSQAVGFGIGYRMSFNGSATKGAQILLFADPEGANVDFTIGSYADFCDAGDIEVDPGKTVEGFVPLLREPKYVKVAVKNLDTAQSITGISLWSQVQKP